MSVHRGKTINRLIAAAGFAIILGGIPAGPALAQTVDCRAVIDVLLARAAVGQHMLDELTHAGVAASLASIHLAYDPLYQAQHYAETDCSELRPAAPPAPGANGTLQGKSVYFPQGAFLKVADDLTIYEVWNGRLYAIQTWGQYLRLGGLADLSNVYQVTVADLAGIPSAGNATN
jgi:hypothetical protein